MDNSTSHHLSETDERLIAFISNFADSGKSMYHAAAKLGHTTGRHLIFLQELFDQYVHSTLYDLFSDEQRKEFEFLVAKYELVRSEVYAKYE
ncbi:MAG: hypothetical protein RL259_655 [Bacteroidota bacterium]|jgi:hypothetical protein